ncbi:MAG: RNA 2',3'-cyclic phosphodiesterase [Caldimonas sp.]
MTKEPTSARLFTALWPDPAARAALARFRDGWTWPPGAKPVADENLHATLHFIGSFPLDRIGALSRGLDAVRMEATTLRAEGSEVWRGGIAVLMLRAEPLLSDLHGQIGSVLSGLGVALDERPFAPHVTLARKARHAAPPAGLPDFEWRAAGFALVESRGGGRADYRVLEVWRAADAG